MGTRGRLALLCLLLAALLPACGGGKEAATTTGATTAVTTAPAPTETETAPPAAQPTVTVEVRKGRPIGPGSNGRRVADLQRALAALGFKPGKPDGIYGERTRTAIMAFQRQHKLEPDGVVGAETARAINDALAELAGGSGG